MNLLAAIQSWPVSLQTVLLLLASNVFMTFAWYGHLRSLSCALVHGSHRELGHRLF